MKHYCYNPEVADYLNNKFGEDFTQTETYPYWMENIDKPYWKNMDFAEEYYEKEENELNRPMTDEEFKCWCKEMDEILMQGSYEENDEEKNVVGYIR